MRSVEAASLSTSKMRDFFVQARDSSSIEGLVRSYNTNWTEKIRLRTSEVRIRSGNIFTERFRPPPGKIARKLTDNLFGKTKEIRYLQNSRSRLSLAILEYAILLTIHPLSDGNGRLARLLFAARMSGGVNSPVWALAFARLHRSRGRAFHIAMQGVRMGSPEMLLHEFDSCAHFAEVEQGDILNEIEHLLETSGISERVIVNLNAIREWMVRELKAP